MKNKDKRTAIPAGDQPDGASGSPDSCCKFGVSESQFPFVDRCFSKSVSVLGNKYEPLCPYCSIWTSLPEGAALKVTHIFDCAVCGYGKRISEEDR